jgi:hypothetical protein
VVLLCVVGFIKDQEVDFLYLHESIKKAFMKNVGCANYDHVFIKLIFPRLLVPVVYPHIAVEMTDILVNIVSQNSSLLENKCHAVNLFSFSIYPHSREMIKYQEEGNATGFAISAIDQFALQDLFEKQDCDQSLSGA